MIRVDFDVLVGNFLLFEYGPDALDERAAGRVSEFVGKVWADPLSWVGLGVDWTYNHPA